MENFVKIDRYYVSKLFPKRSENSNKGTFGTVLNFAGSIYYPGAAFLSSLAALRAGCGLVRLATESSVIPVIASQTPDVTYIDLGSNEFGTIPKDAHKIVKEIKAPSAIAVGCGLSALNPIKEFVPKLLKNYLESSIPVVIDADAINVLSLMENPPLPLNSVITPHPLELSRLIKVDAEQIQSDRLKWANYASSKLDCIVILKGHNTVISIPNGNTFVNTTGSSALAHGGTGDILCGMIAGFAAQGMKLEDASILAVYLHGRAGEIAGKKLSEYSVLASDVLKFVPFAIKEFF